MSHKHLIYLQRCQILALWKAGFNQTQIDKEVGGHKSTICREFERNFTFSEQNILPLFLDKLRTSLPFK